MSRMRRLWIAALALGALLPCTAAATPIQWGGESASDALTVSSYSSAAQTTQLKPYSGSGGEMDWTWISGTRPADTDGYNSTFYAYCVDLLHNLTSPAQAVAIRSTDLLNPAGLASPVPGEGAQGPTVAHAGAKAAWLYNTYAADIHSDILHGAAGAGVEAAALQVAIWDAVYDTSASLLSGAFVVHAAAADVTAKATTYLTNLYSSNHGTTAATWLDAVTMCQSGCGPDQLWNPPGPSVTLAAPEPASIVLLGTGLLGLAHGLRRRRRKTAAAAGRGSSA